MTQLWDDILPSETLRDSRIQILNRDEAVKSNFSGVVFPTTDLVVGMHCYRTDLVREFRLESIGPDVWIPFVSGGVSGILPVLEGGTGSSTASGARTNLGLGGLAVLNAVDTAEVVDNAITNVKMADNSVDTAEIVNGSVDKVKLGPDVDVGVESTTRMIFHQTAAPTGWTKDVSQDNKALRVVAGTVGGGGSVNFDTAFDTPAVTGSVSGTTGGHALSIAEMPTHNHAIGGAAGAINVPVQALGSHGTSTTANTGGGAPHNHSISGSVTGSVVIDVKYTDVILAVKD